MRLPIRRVIARCGQVVLGAALAAGVLTTPAVAEIPALVVANAASFQSGPVPRGALLTIYVLHKRVTPEEYFAYTPWTTSAHWGLWVDASCNGHDDFKPLPILYNGWEYDGNHINVYYPNSIGTEPWGSCANSGDSRIRVHPAGGAAAIEGEVIMLPAHPGVFMEGQGPAGDHVPNAGASTQLSQCPTLLQSNPKACTVRIAAGPNAGPSKLSLFLTGAEWFVCNPCDTGDIRFELAPTQDAPEGSWVAQDLVSIGSPSNGVENAIVKLKPDTAPGVHYLRVRNVFRSEYPPPLRVEFGQPA